MNSGDHKELLVDALHNEQVVVVSAPGIHSRDDECSTGVTLRENVGFYVRLRQGMLEPQVVHFDG